MEYTSYSIENSIEEKIRQARLTEPEKTALLESPEHGLDQAALFSYPDIASFEAGMNNFPLFFSAIGTQALRREMHKPFQRFLELYPKLDQELTQQIQSNPTTWREDKEIIRKLYRAYQYLSELVDINDRDVTREGAVDPFYLSR